MSEKGKQESITVDSAGNSLVSSPSKNKPDDKPTTEIQESTEKITDQPGNTIPEESQHTIQPLSDNPGYPTITQGEKIENRPLDVQTQEDKTDGKAETSKETAGNDKKAANPSPTLTHPASIRQSLFINALYDPASPTFGNQTASYKAVYGKDKPDNVAAPAGSRLARKVKENGWIDDVLESVNAGIKDRVADLAAITANKTSTRKVKRQVLSYNHETKKREVIELVDEYEPSHAERIKAHDIINKLSGDYDVTKHNNRVAEAEYKTVLKHVFVSSRRTGKRTTVQRDVTGTDTTGKDGVGGTEA